MITGGNTAGQPRLSKARRFRQHHPHLCGTLIALAAYALTAAIVTYPLVFNLSTSLAGNGDNYEYHWTLWRVQQVLSGSGGGLARLPWLNHPAGLYHPFMLTMLTVDLTAAPFLLIFPPHVVYNVIFLSGFVLCGLSAYWFATALTGNRQAGLLAGFVFGFFSNKMGHALAGHLPQTLAYWPPLFGLLLWCVLEQPVWRRAVLCGLVLIPTLLVHPIHVVYFVLPLTLALFLEAITSWRGRLFGWNQMRALLVVFGVAALVVTPVLWPSISGEWDEGYLRASGTVRYSTDLLAWVTPSPYHPLFRLAHWIPGYATDVFPSESTLYEGLAYPGILVALLASWALLKSGRKTWTWAVLAVVCLALSLGPILKMGGETVVYTVDDYETNVVLPYALVKSLPLVSVSRTPGRISETAVFALAMLVALGFDALPDWLTCRWRSSALATVLAAGIVLETLVVWPMPLRDVGTPETIRALAAERPQGAVLHVPLFPEATVKNEALHYQTLHERPIVGGWVHRQLPQAKPWTTTFSGLLEADPEDSDIVPRPGTDQRTVWLEYLDVDYMILHKDQSESTAEYRSSIEKLAGAPIDECEALAAFAIPTDGKMPSEPYLYTVGGKWSAPLRNDAGEWVRWVRGSGHIYIYSTETRQVRIAFAADSALDLAHLELLVDGVTVDRFVVCGRMAYYSRALAWEPGMHTLIFRRVYESQALSAQGGRWDVLAIGGVRVIPEDSVPPEASLDIDLGGLTRLTGYALETSTLQPGGTLPVTLYWTASQPLSEDYVVFAHLVNEDGSLVTQWDGEPWEGRFPTTSWPTGSIVAHQVQLRLPVELAPDAYSLRVGMYRWPSLERLPVSSDVPGAEANLVELQKLRIRE